MFKIELYPMIAFGVLCVIIMITIHFVSFNFFQTVSISQIASECSPILGTVDLKVGNKFFFFGSPSTSNWYGAGDYCRDKGGELAHIETSQEFEALTNYFKQNSLKEIFWTRITLLSAYSGVATPFLKWAPGYPLHISGGNLCVGLNLKDGSLGMGNHHCYDKRYKFICEVTKAHSDCAPSQRLDNYTKIGKKFYYIENTTEYTWYESQNLCRQMNGNLADIESPEEMELMSEHLRQIGLTYHSIWLGGNDLAYEGRFQSVITGKPLSYFQWSPNEPNNGNNGTDNCLNLWFVDGAYYMNDWSCYGTAFYICEAS